MLSDSRPLCLSEYSSGSRHKPEESCHVQSLVIPDPNFSDKIAKEDLENRCPEQDGDSENPDSAKDQDGVNESPARGGGEDQVRSVRVQTVVVAKTRMETVRIQTVLKTRIGTV